MNDKHVLITLLLCMTACLTHAQHPPEFTKRLTAFTRSKPVIRTNDYWEEQRGRIWVFADCSYKTKTKPVSEFRGYSPVTAGLQSSYKAEYAEGGNASMEYITHSGQVYWLPAGMTEGGGAQALVPAQEPAQTVRLYDWNGDLVGTYEADPKTTPFRWEPVISEDSEWMLRRVTGNDQNVSNKKFTIRIYTRTSADNGVTWSDFDIVPSGTPVMKISDEDKKKPELLVEVFSSYGMNFEITRYRMQNNPGAKPVPEPRK